ncbi:MAG: hypothetical protein KGN97_08355, partial [Bacteroidota bacterium]|nr:hypothetical protein [Bacteroidota bacterium]
MYVLLISFGCIYLVAFAILSYGFKRMQVPIIPAEYQAATKFSIIVPARNEEQNIEKLIHSFNQLKYPNG